MPPAHRHSVNVRSRTAAEVTGRKHPSSPAHLPRCEVASGFRHTADQSEVQRRVTQIPPPSPLISSCVPFPTLLWARRPLPATSHSEPSRSCFSALAGAATPPRELSAHFLVGLAPLNLSRLPLKCQLLLETFLPT